MLPGRFCFTLQDLSLWGRSCLAPTLLLRCKSRGEEYSLGFRLISFYSYSSIPGADCSIPMAVGRRKLHWRAAKFYWRCFNKTSMKLSAKPSCIDMRRIVLTRGQILLTVRQSNVNETVGQPQLYWHATNCLDGASKQNSITCSAISNCIDMSTDCIDARPNFNEGALRNC